MSLIGERDLESFLLFFFFLSAFFFYILDREDEVDDVYDFFLQGEPEIYLLLFYSGLNRKSSISIMCASLSLFLSANI